MRAFSIFAVLAAVMTVAPAAHATFPGPNGRIAYTSEQDGNPEIYSMTSDGLRTRASMPSLPEQSKMESGR
jgi:hypothetical protein